MACGAAAAAWTGWDIAHAAWTEYLIHRGEVALVKGRPGDALDILWPAPEGCDLREDLRWRCTATERRARVELKDATGLVAMLRQQPSSVLVEEDASLLAARGLAAMGRPKDARRVIRSWRGRSRQSCSWSLVAADVAAAEGQRAEARQSLTAARCTGSDEAARLLRLAMIEVPSSRDRAHGFLLAAQKAAPHEPDVDGFLARFYETRNLPGEAVRQYEKAVQDDPKNPFWRDQLAGFQRRQGRLSLAVAAWSTGMLQTPADYLAVQGLFWGRIVEPVSDSASAAVVPDGPVAPLAGYLRTLKAGAFRNDSAFQKLLATMPDVGARPEIWWLDILQSLADGREGDAADRLSHPPSSASLDPALEFGLRRVLAARAGDVIPAPLPWRIPGLHRHLAWATGAWTKTDMTKARSPEAFAQLFLAAGWMRAALDLRHGAVPADAPDWYPFALAQALRRCRGTAEALAFVGSQPRTSAMTLLRAQLLLAQGHGAQAEAAVAPLLQEKNGLGSAAAWLMTVSAAQAGRFKDAERWYRSRPELDSATRKK